MIAGATSKAWQRASVATPLPEDVARAIVSFGADHPSMLRNPEELAGSLGASGALAELAQLRPVV